MHALHRPSRAAIRLAAALTPLALAAVLAACGRADGANAPAGGPPPAPVAVLKAAAADLPAAYEYVGQTAGSRDIEVRARVNGILMKRNFTEGGSVKRGQSLYTLDTAAFQSALSRADAEVTAA